ncbi:MAG: PCYCGC motif-containing (lipo)protein [Caldilineaceae bacterium]
MTDAVIHARKRTPCAATWVQDAHCFVGANADVLSQFPCYCGCGPMGHGSNYACFWQREGVLDTHALGCGICVDIAQDVMRGMKQGHLPEIPSAVDDDKHFTAHQPPIAKC